MIGVVRMHRPKESWAAKRAEQALRCECSEHRLLLGQREVKTFPVLDMGMQPEVERADWQLNFHGLVAKPITLDWT